MPSEPASELSERDARAFRRVSGIMERPPSPNPWFRLLYALPWLALGCVYLEALLAALTLGHWPIPSINDPKDLQIAPIHLLSTLISLSVYPGALALGIFAIRGWSTLRRSSRSWFWLGFCLLGHLLLFASCYIDPGRVWYWWMD